MSSAKLADGAITSGKIVDGAVTSAKVADSAITSGKLGDGAVTSAKVADGAITSAKFNTAALAPNADKLDGLDSTQILPLFARIAADGSVIASRGVVSVSWDGGGFYQITFNRFMENCAVTVTGADAGVPKDLNIAVQHYPETFSRPEIFVRLFDDSNAMSAAAFDLIAVC